MQDAASLTVRPACLLCIQHHYVERLHRLYLYCAPTLFWGLWKIVSPFVDPVTR
jgi:hypothetical protein